MWLVLWLLMFISSRRRHTRFDCDWSSDVCSSDLPATPLMAPVLLGRSVMGFSTPDRIDASRGRALSRVAVRPRVHGKFLYVGDEKLLVRGVTYGPFRPDATGSEYHDAAAVERDLAAIAANGLNAIRTYTVPPRWFLDAAQGFGLRVMVGLPWAQHVAFLGDKKTVGIIERCVREGVRACAGH